MCKVCVLLKIIQHFLKQHKWVCGPSWRTERVCWSSERVNHLDTKTHNDTWRKCVTKFKLKYFFIVHLYVSTAQTTDDPDPVHFHSETSARHTLPAAPAHLPLTPQEVQEGTWCHTGRLRPVATPVLYEGRDDVTWTLADFWRTQHERADLYPEQILQHLTTQTHISSSHAQTTQQSSVLNVTLLNLKPTVLFQSSERTKSAQNRAIH